MRCHHTPRRHPRPGTATARSSTGAPCSASAATMEATAATSMLSASPPPPGARCPPCCPLWACYKWGEHMRAPTNCTRGALEIPTREGRGAPTRRATPPMRRQPFCWRPFSRQKAQRAAGARAPHFALTSPCYNPCRCWRVCVRVCVAHRSRLAGACPRRGTDPRAWWRGGRWCCSAATTAPSTSTTRTSLTLRTGEPARGGGGHFWGTGLRQTVGTLDLEWMLQLPFSPWPSPSLSSLFTFHFSLFAFRFLLIVFLRGRGKVLDEPGHRGPRALPARQPRGRRARKLYVRTEPRHRSFFWHAHLARA